MVPLWGPIYLHAIYISMMRYYNINISHGTYMYREKKKNKNLGGKIMKNLELALKPEEIKDIKQREIVSKSMLLQEIVEKNFFTSGRFEISNIQLSEITGKEIKQINRDIKE